jgi:hypothetical protein
MEWATFELHDSLIQKTDDNKTLQKIGQIKDGNSDLDEIFQWLEEYSTIKQNQKDEIDNVIQKNAFQENSQNFNKYAILNVSEENLRNIEEPHFDIFCLEEEAGKENTLSVISNYIFITLGLYSVINYTNLENFLQGITIGYSRANPYHNVKYKLTLGFTCS